MINWGVIGIEVVFKTQEVTVGRKEKKMTLTLSVRQRGRDQQRDGGRSHHP